MSHGLDLVHAVGDHVSASDGRNELFRYVYSADDPQVESPRPFFHPLRSRAGDVVSVYRPWDHLWHKGLALSLPHVGPENFWGGPTYVHPDGYTALGNNGAMRQRDAANVNTVDGRALIDHDLVWTTQAGHDLVRERRTILAELVGDDAWSMTITSALEHIGDDRIVIGSPTTAGRPNAGYGGWFWRGPREFAGAEVFVDGRSGHDELMGATSAWAAITGHHDESDRWSTVVMVDHPSSARHPVKWFTRSSPFACLCPAPFFDEEYPFAPGDRVVLSCTFIVANGRADRTTVDAIARQAQSQAHA